MYFKQSIVKWGDFRQFFNNIFVYISSILYNKHFLFQIYNSDSPGKQFILNSCHCAAP